VAGDSLSLGATGGGGTYANRFSVQVQTYLQTQHGGTWEIFAPGGQGGLTGTSGALHITSSGWGVTQTYRLAIFEMGINNQAGNNKYPSGTYADDDEAHTGYATDIAALVSLITASASIPASHILICGVPPYGDTRIGGTAANEARFIKWNTLTIPNAATAAGAIFVPMDDVYGTDYDPNDDPDSYFPVDTTHPNEAGHTLIANRIISYLPGDLARPRRATA